MSFDALSYLFDIYWPYLLGAVVIGLGAGWFSYSAPKK
jgi:hypothetical protein